MAYKTGGEGLETLVEFPYSGDSRNTENFSSSNYKKAGAAWNQPYIKYDSNYSYIEGFSKYKKAGEIFLCKKGTRPALKNRYTVTSVSGNVSKATDGSVIFTPDGATPVTILPASLNVKWFIMDLVGGGGGGAGQNGVNSGGGGGGGGYALCLLQFKYETATWRIILGNGGPGGTGYQLGGHGGDSYLIRASTVLTCTGGKGGGAGDTIAPGGQYGSAYTAGTNLTNYSYGYCITQVNGGKGGDKGNSGGEVHYSYTIPSPEDALHKYTMAGGVGYRGGGGGASAIHGGGRGGTSDAHYGANGQYGSGGGGAAYGGTGWSGGTGGHGCARFYY